MKLQESIKQASTAATLTSNWMQNTKIMTTIWPTSSDIMKEKLSKNITIMKRNTVDTITARTIVVTITMKQVKSIIATVMKTATKAVDITTKRVKSTTATVMKMGMKDVDTITKATVGTTITKMAKNTPLPSPYESHGSGRISSA